MDNWARYLPQFWRVLPYEMAKLREKTPEAVPSHNGGMVGKEGEVKPDGVSISVGVITDVKH
ncbi:MAG: hypothetical protein IH874_02455 [Candidatus Dadabacteria bacterium]|nr:hypothetical protein [Candidatus Dadabacteria bacterium]